MLLKTVQWETQQEIEGKWQVCQVQVEHRTTFVDDALGKEDSHNGGRIMNLMLGLLE